MNFDDICHLLHILEDGGVASCLVGELALNYYKVPRVVHVRYLCRILVLKLLTTIIGPRNLRLQSRSSKCTNEIRFQL